VPLSIGGDRLHAMFGPTPEPKPIPHAHSYAIPCSVKYLVQNKCYGEALKLLERTDYRSSPELLVLAAKCRYHEGKITSALELLLYGLKSGWKIPEIYKLKGQCLFKQGEFTLAHQDFVSAFQIQPDVNTQLWIQRCEARFTLEDDPASPNILVFETPPPVRIRHDFYQSASHITLVIYVPNLTEEQLKVTFETMRVDVEIFQRECHLLKFKLEKAIIPDKSASRIALSKGKVEIQMAKAVPGTKSGITREDL
jgi:tetratricopeptide (TPR) repeat protein